MNADNNTLVLNGAATGVVHLAEENSIPEPLEYDPVVRIRPYRETDRRAICRLCCETGFLGGPVDTIFQDRELFADLFTRPYLDDGPEWVFVAEARKQVVGYVLGSVGPRFGLVLLRSGF